MRNLLLSFDDFAGKELITERDLQDYSARYQDLRDEWSNRRANGESVDIIDDIVLKLNLSSRLRLTLITFLCL